MNPETLERTELYSFHPKLRTAHPPSNKNLETPTTLALLLPTSAQTRAGRSRASGQPETILGCWAGRTGSRSSSLPPGRLLRLLGSISDSFSGLQRPLPQMLLCAPNATKEERAWNTKPLPQSSNPVFDGSCPERQMAVPAGCASLAYSPPNRRTGHGSLANPPIHDNTMEATRARIP